MFLILLLAPLVGEAAVGVLAPTPASSVRRYFQSLPTGAPDFPASMPRAKAYPPGHSSGTDGGMLGGTAPQRHTTPRDRTSSTHPRRHDAPPAEAHAPEPSPHLRRGLPPPLEISEQACPPGAERAANITAGAPACARGERNQNLAAAGVGFAYVLGDPHKKSLVGDG